MIYALWEYYQAERQENVVQERRKNLTNCAFRKPDTRVDPHFGGRFT